MSRIENDAFYTPDNVAMACVEDFYKELPEYRNHEIAEPSAGGGAFLRAFEKHMYGSLKYTAMSGRVSPNTINFHSSYPELNRGWIDIDY